MLPEGNSPLEGSACVLDSYAPEFHKVKPGSALQIEWLPSIQER